MTTALDIEHPQLERAKVAARTEHLTPRDTGETLHTRSPADKTRDRHAKFKPKENSLGAPGLATRGKNATRGS